MAKRTGNKLQALGLTLVVVVLCFVFLLQFGGPQAEGCSKGGTTYAARVYGETISDGDFRAAYILAGFDQRTLDVARENRLKEVTLDALVERNLLAREARALGFEVVEKDVWDRFTEKGTVYLSRAVDTGFPKASEIQLFGRDNDDKFDIDSAKGFIQRRLRRSIEEFGKSQIEEQLAQRMREVLESTVEVTQREVRDAWVRERESATINYVQFSPNYYRTSAEPAAAELDQWMASHVQDVDQEYQRQRHRYTGLEKQVRARHVLIKAASGASDEIKRAARARADALLARARAGADFATLARENSEDTGSARRGGDLGYRPRGPMVGPFDDAQFALRVGEISNVVETTFGYHVIKVEGVREGDVPEAEAKRELADRLWREQRAGDLARQAAEQALRELREGRTSDALDARLRGVPEGTPESDTEEHVDPLVPRVKETRPFGRGEVPVAGVDSAALTQAAFGLTMDSPLPAAPIKVQDDWFVIQLTERVTAEEEDFSDGDRNRLHDALLRSKQQEALAVYVRLLRDRARGDGALRINEEILRYGEEDSADEEGAEGGEEKAERSNGRGEPGREKGAPAPRAPSGSKGDKATPPSAAGGTRTKESP